jgi:hypothetical protein
MGRIDGTPRDLLASTNAHEAAKVSRERVTLLAPREREMSAPGMQAPWLHDLAGNATASGDALSVSDLPRLAQHLAVMVRPVDVQPDRLLALLERVHAPSCGFYDRCSLERGRRLNGARWAVPS